MKQITPNARALNRVVQIFLHTVYFVMKPSVYVLLNGSKRSRVIIRCGDEVLLIKPNFGDQKWGLPGGGMKRAETPKQSTVRETFEEVGIVLRPEKLLFITEQRSGLGPFSWPYVDLVFYEYRLLEKPKKLRLQWFEVSESRWFTKEDLAQATDIEQNIATLVKSSLQ